MASGDQSNIVPPQRSLPREDPAFSPVGDLFAPFFDVVFYSPSKETGLEAEPDPFDFEATIANAVRQAQQSALQRAALGNTASIGSTTLALRSVGGGLQSFSPEGPDSEIGQLINYRSSLEITMLSAAALQATLTLNPPYEAALKIVDNQLIQFGSLMEIQWGYLALDGSGSPAVSDKGLFRITQPSIKFGQQVSVTIGGFDMLSSALQTTETRRQWSREQFPTDLDIVKEIIKTRAGAGMKLDDVRVKATSSLRKKKQGKGVTQTDDDWSFFRRLLRQNDVTFMPAEATIVLADEETVAVAEPRYRMFWYGQVQSEFDIPMSSFETNPIMSLFASSPGTRGQRTIKRDPETGEYTVMERDPGTTGVAQPGEANTATTDKSHDTTTIQTSSGQVAAYAPLGEDSAGRILTQPGHRPNQEEEDDRENRELRMFFNTRASAVCPGVPGLLPQQIVEVRNVGDLFSGNYRVMKVVHSIGAGYTMKVDLLRSAASGTVGQGTIASPDKPNTKPVDPETVAGQTVTPTDQTEDSKLRRVS